MTRQCILLLAGLLWAGLLGAQNVTLSGYVRDAETGEDLIAANVYVKGMAGKGTTTNVYGFYSLTLPAGSYEIAFSYLGYTETVQRVSLESDLRLNMDLQQGVTIQEVVVTAEDPEQNVRSTEMGTVELQVSDIKRLPAIFGEVDVLKSIQLLPGVLSAGEGNSGFYVRGGGPDQNLILLDEAVVYNAGHLLGFFSVFNADALKNTTLYKGGMPANFGGRLSSVVDVQMKEGNNKRYGAEGGIGLIASRLTLEGPIVKDQSSFMVSGRRTYAGELAQPFLEGGSFAGTNYYFYDLNAKVNYKFTDKDRLYASAYFGRDVLQYNSAERGFNIRLPYGNSTATLRWNHLFSDKLFMNASLIYNDYNFTFTGVQDRFTFSVASGIRDYNAKVDFDYIPSTRHSIKFGLNYTYHRLSPNVVNAESGDVSFSNNLQPKYGHEYAAYINDDWTVNERLSISYGLRLSAFTQVGPYVSKISTDTFASGTPIITYGGIEPRVNVKYGLTPSSSLKGSVAVTTQYLHLVSNSTTTLPADVWVPSTELVEPQRGIQYAVGYFQNFSDNMFETSLELYYRDLYNQIDYSEFYTGDASRDVEEAFVYGQGRAYGAEVFLKKSKGQLTGWIGYTLARTEREFDDINNGEPYPAVYDRRHDLSVVASYALSEKWDLGATFIYGSGNAYTPVKSFYFIDFNLYTEYGARNSARIDDYHRLDLSATYTPNPRSEKNFSSSWTFSIYNAYNRRNVFFVYYAPETDLANGAAQVKAYKVSIFPIIPSVTWNFKIK